MEPMIILPKFVLLCFTYTLYLDINAVVPTDS